MADNNFENFFDLNKPMNIKEPSLLEVVNGLIEMTAERPLFYMNAKLRMYVCAGIAFCNNKMMQHKEEGTQPPLTLAHAAFMMLLSDTMSATYDDYAGDMERQAFPHDRDEYVDNAIREYGDPQDPF